MVWGRVVNAPIVVVWFRAMVTKRKPKAERSPTIDPSTGKNDNSGYIDALTVAELFARTRKHLDGLEELVRRGASHGDVEARLRNALAALGDVDGSTRRRRQKVLYWINHVVKQGGPTDEAVHAICSIAAMEHHDPMLSTNMLGMVNGHWAPEVMDLAQRVVEVWPRRNRPKWPTVNEFLTYWGLECPNAIDLAHEWIAAQKLSK